MLHSPRLLLFFMLSCTLVSGLKPLQHTQFRLQRPDLMIDAGLNSLRKQLSWRNWALIMASSMLVSHYFSDLAQRKQKTNKERYAAQLAYLDNEFKRKNLEYTTACIITQNMVNANCTVDDPGFLIRSYIYDRNEAHKTRALGKLDAFSEYIQQKQDNFAAEIGALTIPLITMFALRNIKVLIVGMQRINRWLLTASFDASFALSHADLVHAVVPLTKALVTIFLLKNGAGLLFFFFIF